MKFTSIVGAVGASTLLLSGAGAIELDIKSPGTPTPPEPRTAC
jgi:hypothetical protein